MAAAFLFAAIVGTFWPALSTSYVNYDDPDYLINNPQVQSGLNGAAIKWAFTTTTMSNWHPLTWISHMLDCQIFGPRLWGHHLTSVLLHALNAVLVFLGFHLSTRSFWRSLFLAACFGLHPLRVESVVWLSERKDVLSAFFGLGALLAYVGYTAVSGGNRVHELNSGTLRAELAFHHRPAARYTLALLLFALSLLSKPMMVTLPCVMLLLDFWPLARFPATGWWPLLREKIPFFILSAAMSAVTFLAQRSGGAMEQMAQYSTGHHLANACVSYVRYLGKFFWPENLAPIYPVVEHWPVWIVASAAALLITTSAIFAWLRNRAGFALTGWLWFLGTLVPVIGLVAVGEQAMADRYTYFTQIGIALVLTWGIEALTRKWSSRVPWLAVAGGGILLASVLATRQQTRVWANSETLFRHTVAVTADNYSAHANLTAALQEQGKIEEALFHAREVVRLRPHSAEAHSNLGVALARTGRLDEAIVSFHEALRLRPDYADGHHNLALALSQSGKTAEALQEYAEAVRINPHQPVWQNDLGISLANAGRLDEAIRHFQEAVRLEPRYAGAHQNLGLALKQVGRFGDAEMHLQEAARWGRNVRP